MKPKQEKSDKEFKCNIEKIIGKLNDKDNWTKALMIISWYDNPPTVDIRNVCMSVDPHRVSSGISLSNEEADRLVSILLDEGFGSLEDIEKALKKRREIYSIGVSDLTLDEALDVK